MPTNGNSGVTGGESSNSTGDDTGLEGRGGRGARHLICEGDGPLHRALEMGEVGTWQLDLASGELIFNEIEARLLGVRPDVDTISLEEFVRRVHVDDRARVRKAFDALDQNGEMVHLEYRVVRPDGTTIWVSGYGGVYHGPDERAYLLGIHIDVTEKKRVEERLERIEKRRLLSVEAAEIGDWEYDLAEQEAYWSPKSLQQMGLDPEGDYNFEAGMAPIHPEDREEVLAAVERALDPDIDDDQYQVEFRLVRDDGDIVWVESRGDAIFEETGRGRQPLRLVGAMVDVTERKRAEERLRESERRLATLMSNLPGMAYRCLNERDWPMLFVSKGSRLVCGYEPDQLVSGEVVWNELVQPDEREELWEAVQEAVERRERFEVEYRIEHADGSQRWLWEQGCGVFDSEGDGELVAIEGFISDITARKEAEEELRKADRRKDQFLAMLGHELRNPLMAVSSAAELLARADDPPPLIARAQRIIARQSRHMTRLIDGLLDISRITRGKLELHVESISPVEIVRNLLEDRQEQLAERQVEFDVEKELEEVEMEADPVRISQVFDNLLVNAIKFTDEGDQIRIELRCDEGQLVASMADSGAGIAPDLLAEIFEPFHQAPREEGRAQEGLGLGLALARELVELHEGALEAHSEGPGTGSKFIVRLPLDSAEESQPQRASATPSNARRILLVEDHPDISEILSLQLSRVGYQVETTVTATEGLQAARRMQPDIVLCDLGLPEVSGFEFARRVRRSEGKLADTPLVALTGYGDRNTRRRSLEAGFDAHLVKPVDVDEVVEVFEELVG